MIDLRCGDCLDALREMPDNSIDSVVTDPPYALAFIGKRWDTGEIAFSAEFWAEVLRVLKPGGHVAAFGGTRTYHRLACAIEDAGFEIRDQLQWIYGTGFPKSHDVSKGIDKAAGAEREVVGSKWDLPGYHLNGHDGGEAFGAGLSSSTPETRLKSSQITAPATEDAKQWAGWGTALKPANEPICLARKPLSEGTVAANVLRWGTGALNIDGTRVEAPGVDLGRNNNARADGTSYVVQREAMRIDNSKGLGRWPANVLHDGSAEVVGMFPETGVSTGGQASLGAFRDGKIYGAGRNEVERRDPGFGDSGSAARFFYSAKASKSDRCGSKHPTVKPVSLMRWLCRLVTPPGGTVLDPFAGTGTTGQAAIEEGFRAVLIEREPEYQADIRRRIEAQPKANLISMMESVE